MITFKSKYQHWANRLVSLVFLCFLFSNGSAQSFTLSTTTTNFTVSTTTLAETPSSIASSIELSITSRNRSYDVEAFVSAQNFNPSSTTFSPIPLSVQFRSLSGVSNSSGVVSGAIPLVENPPGTSTLISNAPRTSNSTAVWTYDLILDPIGYSVQPGNYIFTVTVRYSDNQSTILRTFNINLTVQPLVALSLTQNAPTTVALNSAAAYSNGVQSNNFCTVGVKANVPWLVTLASQASFFTPASSGAANNLPCSVIGFRSSGNTTFSQLSTTPKSLQAGSRGDATTSGNTIGVDMRFSPGYNYNPGIYNLSLIYTLTSQ